MLARRYRFPLLFLLIYGILQVLYLSAPERLINGVVVEQWTVQPAVGFIDALWPAANARARGSSIQSPQGTLNVLRGCEGTETILMLVAAVLATRCSWIRKLVGLVLGTTLVYLCNQLRIAGMFWIVRHHHQWFPLFHGYIAPLLIIGISLVFFVLWSQYPLDRDRAGQAA